jgi:hypothetical protein
MSRVPRAQCLPVPVHDQIVEIKDTGLAAMAATGIQIGLLRRS